MGDIADMILDGQMCQWCCEIIGDGDGYPVICQSCQKENNVDQHGEDRKPKKTSGPKVKCPVCQKKIKHAGLAMHRKDVHGG